MPLRGGSISHCQIYESPTTSRLQADGTFSWPNFLTETARLGQRMRRRTRSAADKIAAGEQAVLVFHQTRQDGADTRPCGGGTDTSRWRLPFSWHRSCPASRFSRPGSLTVSLFVLIFFYFLQFGGGTAAASLPTAQNTESDERTDSFLS